MYGGMDSFDRHKNVKQLEIEEKVKTKMNDKNDSISYISRFVGKTVEVKDKNLRAFPAEYLGDSDIVKVNLSINLMNSLPDNIGSLSTLPLSQKASNT